MGDLIQAVVGFGGLITTIILLQKAKSRVPKDQSSQDSLSKNEKIVTWIVCIFNPILAGAILYFGWKKRLPVKAKEANKISWIAFAVVLLIGVALALLGVWDLEE